MGNNSDFKKSIYSAIIGLAAGDAVGVPAEFIQPHIIAKHPVTEMCGGGTHGMPLGTWSDDTSLTIAAAAGLAESGCKPDYNKIMDNFTAWLGKAEFTATGEIFDVGGCCMQAIHNYYRKKTDPVLCGPKSEQDCGNGAIMRIIPALFWCRRFYGEGFIRNAEALEVIHNLTALTHGHSRCLMANGIYLSIADKLLSGKDKETSIREGIDEALEVYRSMHGFTGEFKHFERLAAAGFAETPREEIRSKGYVIDTIEAAVWCFLNTESYRECILKAVNLGHDTDTIAAVAGALAGIYYGLGDPTGIPAEWVNNLLELSLICDICDRFAEKLA